VKSFLLLVQSQPLVYLLTAHNGYLKHPNSGVQIPATNQWLIHYQKECLQCGWLGIGFLFSNSHPFGHYRFQTYPAWLLPSKGKNTIIQVKSWPRWLSDTELSHILVGQDSFLWYHPVCSVVHDCLLQLTLLLPLCPPLLCQHQNSVSGPAWALKLPSKKCRQCQILKSKRMTRVRVHKDNTCKAG
jgi:hypothetical protein